HLILVRRTAPLPLDRVLEFQAKARGAVKIRRDDDISGRGKELRIPAIVELVLPSVLRPAVHHEQQRVLSGWIEIRRLHLPRLNRFVLPPGECETRKVAEVDVA